MMSLITYIGVSMGSMFVPNAGEYHNIGEIVLVDDKLLVIKMIIEDEVFLRHLTFLEWAGYKFKNLLHRLGL